MVFILLVFTVVGVLEMFFWRYQKNHPLGIDVTPTIWAAVFISSFFLYNSLPLCNFFFFLDRLPRCALPHLELASCWFCHPGFLSGEDLSGALTYGKFLLWLWQCFDTWLHSLRPHRDKHQVPSMNPNQNRNSTLLTNPFHSPHFLYSLSGLSANKLIISWHKLIISTIISSCCSTYLSAPIDSYLKGLNKMTFLQFARIHISLHQ